MGKRIDPQQARHEAAEYLRLALALLDEGGAARAALHVATAIDTLATFGAQAGDTFLDSETTTNEISSHDDIYEFAISWGTLVNQKTV